MTYIIQVKDETGEWVDQVTVAFEHSIPNRIRSLQRKGFSEDIIRVWDTFEDDIYVPTPPRVYTEQEKAAQALHRAEMKTKSEARAKVERAAAALEYEKYVAARDEAAASLETKTVDGESYSALSDAERSVLIDSTTYAYTSTDLGYGDEGAGYDNKKFVENLLKLGWVYRP